MEALSYAVPALFYVVPTLMIGGAVFLLVRITGRSREVRGAWNSGLTAEARCLRTYGTSRDGHGGASTTLHHVYEFTTREGRSVRFAESNGPATIVEGDIVTVHYAAGRPERATAHAPAPGRLAAGQGCAYAFLGVFIAFCLVFMAVAHPIFSVVDEVLP
ncbi:DUF3592 domain-containing protein [Streptomyces carpinensis]|uniref:DUF3592 domain-containing protein n=1 Tax=Streptomyces carpinensis TaxID=66369 RepID=A0ABV1W4F9_9ACTN|nr:DUF3592 domain-containing protein [Streptomyces carpinensis]